MNEAGMTPHGGQRLGRLPGELPSNSMLGVDFESGLKFRTATPGQRRAICLEYMPALEFEVLKDTYLGPTITHSAVTKWYPRAFAAAPTVKLTPVTVLSVRVPFSNRFWMEQAAFGLHNSQHELNLIWQLLVDGVDVLSQGMDTPQIGRPMFSNEFFTLGRNKDEQIWVQPGSLIEVVVLAVADDDKPAQKISACIAGSLEGVQ